MKRNADITVVRIDPDGTVSQQIIRGVNWQEDRKVTVTDKGLLSADFVAVFIPNQSLLPETEIRKGDYVINGIKNYDEITGKELRRRLETDGVVSILSIQDNRHLGTKLGHIELGCA